MAQGIVVPSDERAPVEICEFHSLEDYQAAVDGWIEPIDIPLLGITVYVNEGARRRRMALNSRATLAFAELVDRGLDQIAIGIGAWLAESGAKGLGLFDRLHPPPD